MRGIPHVRFIPVANGAWLRLMLDVGLYFARDHNRSHLCPFPRENELIQDFLQKLPTPRRKNTDDWSLLLLSTLLYYSLLYPGCARVPMLGPPAKVPNASMIGLGGVTEAGTSNNTLPRKFPK